MNITNLLKPNFQGIPSALRDIPRWVLWKGAKVPYCATAINSKASVDNPSSWSPFQQAQTAFEQGGYSGVGIVLAGDGLVGVDLDYCVHDGEPAQAALDLMGRIGCAYVERSPGGQGLRGFGRCNSMRHMKGIRGKMDGLNVELYANGRYLTVTGHPVANGSLMELVGFAEVANEIRVPDLQKRTEDDLSNPLSSSVLPLSSSVGIPTRTIPKEVGQRNRCLFELARHFRGALPEMSLEQQRQIVLEWHHMASPFIDTKDFSISWSDFRNAWAKVKYPHGQIFQSILTDIDLDAPVPTGLSGLGYGSTGHRLVRLCMALQHHHGSAPFFLSARVAAGQLGIHFTDAAKILRALVEDRVLELVSKGSGFKATRYQFIWKG
jgi:hypothetical protein